VYPASGEDFDGPIRIEFKKIRVVGSGPAETIIEYSREDQSYELFGSVISLENLQIRDMVPPDARYVHFSTDLGPHPSFPIQSTMNLNNVVFQTNGTHLGLNINGRVIIDDSSFEINDSSMAVQTWHYLEINNSIFHINGDGIGIRHIVPNAETRISDSVFQGNGNGLGIISHYTYGYFENAVFNNLHTGLLLEDPQDGHCTSCVFSNNIVGIELSGSGHFTIRNSEFINNTGPTGSAIKGSPGGERESEYGLGIINTTFRNNRVTGRGGAVIAMDGSQGIAIGNSTFVDNEVGETGAVIMTRSDSELAYVTIARNQGNGLWIRGGRFTIGRSIIAENSGSQCYGSSSAGFIYMDAPSLIGDETCGPAPYKIIEETALFSDFDDHGGITLPSGNAPYTLGLAYGSPAIDVIECNIDTDGLPSFFSPDVDFLDETGFSRSDGLCDLGAYEFRLLLPAVQLPLDPIIPSLIITLIPSDAVPVGLARVSTLCWEGPGDQYNVVSSVQTGTKLKLLGIGEISGWFIVDNPIYPGVNCWLGSNTVQIDPDVNLSTLKIYPAPPLLIPTSTAIPLEPTAVPLKPPGSPGKFNITNQVCSDTAYTVLLYWADSQGETGYRLYRDGSLISTLNANTTQYSDTPPYGGPYTYTLQAYNNAGSSPAVSVQEAGCIF